jgi:hypothetical protein
MTNGLHESEARIFCREHQCWSEGKCGDIRLRLSSEGEAKRKCRDGRPRPSRGQSPREEVSADTTLEELKHAKPCKRALQDSVRKRTVLSSTIRDSNHNHPRIPDNHLPIPRDIPRSRILYQFRRLRSQLSRRRQHHHCRPKAAHADILLRHHIE